MRTARRRSLLPSTLSVLVCVAFSLGLTVASVPLAQVSAPPVLLAELARHEVEARRPIAVLTIGRPGLRFELTPSTSSMMRLDPASARLGVEATVSIAAGFPFPFAKRTWRGGPPASNATRVVHLGWTVAGETIGASVPATWMPREVDWLRLAASVAVRPAGRFCCFAPERVCCEPLCGCVGSDVPGAAMTGVGLRLVRSVGREKPGSCPQPRWHSHDMDAWVIRYARDGRSRGGRATPIASWPWHPSDARTAAYHAGVSL